MENKQYVHFKGELDIKNKKILSNEIFKTTLLATISPTIIISSLIITISIYFNILYLIFLFIPFVLFIGCLLTPYLTLEPTKEVIIKDNVIYITYGKFEASRDIANVKKVIDYGEGYYFNFYFPHKFIYCFCQKNLIIEGTIDEFESVFKDKIVKI